MQKKYDSTIARIAGNIASGYAAANAKEGFVWSDEMIAQWCVGQARAIVAETIRTEPAADTPKGQS